MRTLSQVAKRLFVTHRRPLLIISLAIPLALLAVVMASASIVTAKPLEPETNVVQQAYEQTLAPVWKNYYDYAGVLPTAYVVTNSGTSPATVLHEYYWEGSLIYSETDVVVPVGGAIIKDLGAIATLPDEFLGWVDISSDQPFITAVAYPPLIKGTVVEPGGFPIVGDSYVCLYYWNPNDEYRQGVDCTTHFLGTESFALPLPIVPSPGSYHIIAYPPGDRLKSSLPREFVVSSYDDIFLGEITLTYPSFAGTVYEPDGVTPAYEGWVSVYKMFAGKPREVAGDSYYSGTYEVGGVPDGLAWLDAHPPEDSIFWHSQPVSYPVAPGSQYTDSPTLVDLTLQDPNLTGMVVYTNGSPVTWIYSDPWTVKGRAWVEVVKPDTYESKDRYTASWGEFGFLLPDGGYRVQAYPEGSLAMTYTKSLPVPVNVPIIADTGPVTLTYPSFTGRVLDPAGNPVTGCLDVWLEDPEGNWVESYWYCGEENKPYRLGGIPTGRYNLRASAPPGSGLSPSSPIPVDVEPGDQYEPNATQHIDLRLRAANVVGVVTTPEGDPLPPAYDEWGDPIYPAYVYVHNADWSVEAWATTNMSGEFGLTLPPGEYILAAHPDWGYPFSYTKSLPESFVVPPGMSGALDLGSIKLTYPRIMGVVVDPDGKRVSTSVSVWSDLGYEDWDDTYWYGPNEFAKPFRFGGMPVGHYFVQADPPWNNPEGYGSSDIQEFDVELGDWYLPSKTEWITLTLGMANFVGDVRFPLDWPACPGCPVPWAWIRLRTEDWSFEDWAGTDDGGRFTFSGLDAGITYTLDFFLPNELLMDWDPPPPDQFALITTTEQITGVYYLRPALRTKRVIGKVVYEDGTPIGDANGDGKGDAWVYAYHERREIWRETRTRLDGSYGFYLKGGRWKLWVEPAHPDVDWYFDWDNEQWVEFSLDPTEMETQTVVFTVTQTTFLHVTGTVEGPDGTPPPPDSTWVDLCTDRGHCFGAPVGPLGGFKTRVIPGFYHVWVWVDPVTGLLPPWNNGFPVTISDDTTLPPIRLRSEADRTARVEGRVIRAATGQGVADVEVQAWTDSGDWANTQTITAGVYALDLLPGYWHGGLELTPEQEELYYVLPPQERHGYVRPNETITNVNFFLARRNAIIRGQVVDEAGAIISDIDGVIYAEYCAPTPDGSCWVVDEAPVQGGSFELRVISGTYEVGIWLLPDAGYILSDTVPVKVGAGGAKNVKLTLLEAEVLIHGNLVDRAGNPVFIEASVYGSDPSGLWVEDWLWPGKDPYEYTLNVISRTETTTWTLELWVDPSTGYVADPAYPCYEIVVEPGVGEIWQPMTVTKLVSEIIGTVWAGSNRPVPHIWVFAKGKPGTPSEGAYFEAETDEQGHFRMPVLAGEYMVGAYLPPHLAATHLPPKKKEWASEADNPIELYFRPKAPVGEGLEISGALSGPGTLPNDAPILVFGWEVGGAYAEVTGTISSGYRLPVISDTVWHVWAAYEDPANNTFYHSQREVVVVTTTNRTDVDLVLTSSELPDPVCQNVDPSQFTRISLPVREGLAHLPEPLIEVKAGTFSGTVEICATPIIAVPGGQNLVGFAYEVEARDNQGNLITTNFNKDVRFIFYFDEAALPPGADPANLEPVYFSTSRGEWVSLEDPFVDATDPEYIFVTGKTNHFSKFGGMSPPAGEVQPPGTVAPASVVISGPQTGEINTAYTFVATVEPGTVSLPITYTWQATGQSDVVTHTNALSHTVASTWLTTGTKFITVTTANIAGSVPATHTIVITSPINKIYLPVVLRNF